jgi:hypothetical protein
MLLRCGVNDRVVFAVAALGVVRHVAEVVDYLRRADGGR